MLAPSKASPRGAPAEIVVRTVHRHGGDRGVVRGADLRDAAVELEHAYGGERYVDRRRSAVGPGGPLVPRDGGHQPHHHGRDGPAETTQTFVHTHQPVCGRPASAIDAAAPVCAAPTTGAMWRAEQSTFVGRGRGEARFVSVHPATKSAARARRSDVHPSTAGRWLRVARCIEGSGYTSGRPFDRTARRTASSLACAPSTGVEVHGLMR